MNLQNSKKICGWTGKFLKVDLSTGRFESCDTMRYAEKYIGGRGIAARIAYEEISRGLGAFSDDNLIIIMTGPLTGTAAPYSGRTILCGLSAQGYPKEWYTRSSFGGHWGPELKYAGWDGIVIRGKAKHPVYLNVEDDRVELLDARSLAGLGIFDTQKKIMAQHGAHTKVFAIGPTGEKLCRIAIIATETESASGQGGFGAVMGSKQLKAIAVKGSGSVRIANPERFGKITRAIAKESHASHGWPHTPRLDPEKIEKYGERFQACTQGCHARCYDARYYTRVKCPISGKLGAGQVDCVATLFPGLKGSFYDWELGFEAGFELAQMCNDLGLNHWELLMGMMPWLRELARSGKMRKINGYPIDLNDNQFWAMVIRGIADRDGQCDALAEGTVRAAEQLGVGEEFIRRFYPAWGYAGHWDGRGDQANHIFYPFWIVSALQWAMDTRDPISSEHGYVQNVMNWSPCRSPEEGLTWEQITELGKKVYGSPDSTDPKSHYGGKAYPASWHMNRSVIKDSVPADDQIFPRIFSRHTEDHYARIDDMEGPDFELHMFNSATGFSLTRQGFDLLAERIVNVERLIHVKLHDRSRSDDETIIPYFEQPERFVNPFVGRPMALEAEKFGAVLDEFYAIRGWSRESGTPTRETLQRLGL